MNDVAICTDSRRVEPDLRQHGARRTRPLAFGRPVSFVRVAVRVSAGLVANFGTMNALSACSAFGADRCGFRGAFALCRPRVRLPLRAPSGGDSIFSFFFPRRWGSAVVKTPQSPLRPARTEVVSTSGASDENALRGHSIGGLVARGLRHEFAAKGFCKDGLLK